MFDALPVGVVVLDPSGNVVVFNSHEERLAGRKRERVLGKPFFVDVAPCMNVRELAGVFFDGVGRGSLDERIEFSFPFPHVDQPRDVVVRLRSFIVDGAPHGLLLVEDVSMQRSLDRMKEMLTSLLVHDMKSPLAAILANFEYLEAVAAPTEAHVAEAVSDGITATRHLSRMILDLLDITRLETGTFPVRRALCSLRAVAADAVHGASARARMRDVTVELVASGEAEGSFDAALVRRVIDNLLDNALRYTPAGRKVVVAVTSDGTLARIDVVDEGPGIPGELRERIFDKYGQVVTSGAAGQNRGLGLTFVRLAARAHGGDVTVSDAPGGGTVFALSFPVAPALPAASRP